MFCITAQHINIIAKEHFMVNHFCNNFDLVCPNHWANSLLWSWMVWTPLSNIRAMPEKPTALTTTPKMNPIMSLLMIVPYLLLTGFNPLACGRQILAGTLYKTRCSVAGRQRQCESDCYKCFHTVSLDNFNTVQLSFTIAVTFYK